MSKEMGKTRVPKLRFPEFREAKEWELINLQEMCSLITKGTTPTSIGFKFIGSGINFIKIESIEESGKINLSKVAFISEECNNALNRSKLKEKDILFSIAGALGVVAIVHRESLPANINQALAIIRLKNGYSHNYLSIFLNSLFIQSEIKKIKAGAAQPNISLGQLGNFSIFLPKEKEQQKIAACLSYLDDLITTQNQKLKALQAHKKGLMQQLFPAEGETVPRVRFGEFLDGEEWEEKTLGECLLQKPEYGINAAAVPFSKNLPTYLRITDISEDGYYLRNQMVSVEKDVTKENYLNEGDIVLARTGASVGKSYKYRATDGKLVFAGFLIRVKPNSKKINSELLFQFLSTEKYWRWVNFISARSGQPGINGVEYASMPITLPPTLNEQQKIAATLTSLDDLLTTQTQKLEALKMHKKGLMQQLFPNPNEIEE